ncbi:MAG: DEAD/DEAH box helicase [Chloroflexi bacterium]|nr:DEAD/DEAH box helicase [Chloroflexota bacterium]
MATAPLDQQTLVALDLETTGLDSQRDEIIEVGAVKFRGQEVLESYHSLVNPYRPLSPFIQSFTGLRPDEVSQAPPFAVVGTELADFVGELPLVGHSVNFDLSFLRRRGVQFSSPCLDTNELAAVLLPRVAHSLEELALHLGIPHSRLHRALEDAQVTRHLFLRLVEQAARLGPGVIAELHRLASVSGSSARYFFQAIEGMPAAGASTTVVLGGVHTRALQDRLRSTHDGPRAKPPLAEAGVDVEKLAQLLMPQGPLARFLPGLEHRQEQTEMLRSVASALEEGQHLVVEAGTGVGKTFAYLIPAMAFAVKNRTRVVIATNTINLQDQLMKKDIPLLMKLAEEEHGLDLKDLKVAVLKGRSNYLCFRRWSRARSAESLSPDEARLAAKVLVWLQDTAAGDRGELHISGREARLWEGLSGPSSQECQGPGGVCFVRAARERAEKADLVIVNHALLLTDLALEAGIIPEYKHLIVDEAHHLEDEATRAFGFRLSQADFEEHFEALAGGRGLAQEAVSAYRGSRAGQDRQGATREAAQALTKAGAEARTRVELLFLLTSRFLDEHREAPVGKDEALRISLSTRAQPGWSDLEVAWDESEAALDEAGRALGTLKGSLEGLEDMGLLNYESLVSELAYRADWNESLRQQARQFFLGAQKERVYWIGINREGSPSLNSAPLNVSGLLKGSLFKEKRSVILTSATLASAGSFAPLRARLGLEEAQELLVGSPFDYRRAVLLCIPQGVKPPDTAGYQQALEEAIVQVAQRAGGRTLVLFTSHSSLGATLEAVRPRLAAQGIRALGQGVDGLPRQLMETYQQDPRAVLLATASFWEGVDLAGDLSLKALVVARLPFNVPTEPVFVARSELYQDPFNEYGVPLAVLRFRQGFGRLIRRKEDRGAVVIMDSRLLSRPYGKAFLDSLPSCTLVRPPLRELGQAVSQWLGF